MIRSSVGQSRKQAWGKCCSGHRGKGWRHLPSETGGGACPSTGGVQTHPRIATSLPVQGHQPQASVTLKEGWLRAAFPNWQSHPEKCHRARGWGESPSARALQWAGATLSFTHTCPAPSQRRFHSTQR